MKKKNKTKKQKWKPLIPITSLEQLLEIAEDDIIYFDNPKRKQAIYIDIYDGLYEVTDVSSPEDVEKIFKDRSFDVYASETMMCLVYAFKEKVFKEIFNELISDGKLFYANDN